MQWLGNEVLEGNTCRNYRKQTPEVVKSWGVWQFNGFAFSVIADPQKLVGGDDPDGLIMTQLDRFIVLRDNIVHSGSGGVAVGATFESKGLMGDVLVEHNSVRQSAAPGVVVNRSQCPTAYVRGNG